MLKNDFETTNFAIFEEVVYNFGSSDDDMISKESIKKQSWCIFLFIIAYTLC